LEDDVLQIVNAIKVELKNWSNFGHVVDGIKEGLNQLKSWRIAHVKREANSAAYVLAREAIKCVIDSVWLEQTLNCIYGIVTREKLTPV
jgi:hypothetical protein